MAATAKTKGITSSYESIIRDVRAGNISPIYYLMGTENYYIDKLSEFLVNSLLTPDEQAFNLVTLYGSDTEAGQVVMAAKTFPMGAKYTVILVKEAQALENKEQLEYYLQQPLNTTVVIFCHRNGKLDKRSKISSMIEKIGVIFESLPPKEGQLPTFVIDYFKRKKYTITPEAAYMMAEYIGADLTRIATEADKLIIALPKDTQNVTLEMVNSQVVDTKTYDTFALQNAIVRKDVKLAMKIAKNFDKNPKEHPIQATLPVLFKFFSNVMLAHYSPDKSPNGIANFLGISKWQFEKGIEAGMKNYTATKTMHIIAKIRQIEAKGKGVDNPNTSSGELMVDLLHFILY